MAGELFRVALKEGYREPLRHKRFVGRGDELALLAELLAERRAATVLVAGFRGAGKTGLVEEALRRAKGTKKQLVVRLAPPFLDSDKSRDSIRAQVLRSLARGLYFTTLDNKDVESHLRARIEATYEKTYLTELESHEAVESVATADARRSKSTAVKASFEPSKSLKFLVGTVGVAIAGALGIGSAAVLADIAGAAWGIVGFAVLTAAALGAGLRLEKAKTNDESFAGQLTAKDSRTHIGRFDLSEETLEFELRRALEDLAKQDFRVTFVLDELDKLELSGTPASDVLESSPVFRIVASLKNFFALGTAVHIFITDDAFFERLALQQQNSDYSLSHTLFTDRFFVGPLHYTELEALVDLSVSNPPTRDDSYDRFKNFVCWESTITYSTRFKSSVPTWFWIGASRY